MMEHCKALSSNLFFENQRLKVDFQTAFFQVVGLKGQKTNVELIG